jgi:hypothetical protein
VVISEVNRPESSAPGSGLGGPSTKLSLIVPAYNEAARLGAGLPRLLDAVPLEETQIIVVDDGSTDGTAEVAKWHLAGLPRSVVLRLPKNSGKGAAVRAGVVKADGELIGYLDADMATDPRDLVRLVERLEVNEVAVGSRTSPDSVIDSWSAHRRLMTRTFSLLVTNALHLPMRDTQCGFKLFHGSVAKLLFHGCRVDGFAFDLDILNRASRLGLEMAEVPVHWSEIPGSKVRVVHDSLAMLVDVGRTICVHRDEAPIHGVVTFSSDPWETAELLRSNVRATDPVLAWDGGCAALFPCTPPTVSARLARELRAGLPSCRLQQVELRFDALCSHPGATRRPARFLAASTHRGTRTPTPARAGDSRAHAALPLGIPALRLIKTTPGGIHPGRSRRVESRRGREGSGRPPPPGAVDARRWPRTGRLR